VSLRGSNVLVAYVASPHNGYLQLFRQYSGGRLYILGRDFLGDFKSLTRHLPGNDPDDARRMIDALGIFRQVEVLTRQNLPEVQALSQIAMPDEDVSRQFAAQYFLQQTIEFDGRWKLRWDWGATTFNKRPEVDEEISYEALDRELMLQAQIHAHRSPDWWRQIGALLVRDGRALLVAFNTHVPSEQTAYVLGDPRSNFDPGQHIDASVALHAEAGIIATAARRGIKTEGCDMFVSTFPCPPCAASVAESGIRRLFYVSGYSLIHGADALKAKDIKLVRVEMEKVPEPA
jgi:dCMP deaminase